MDATYLRIKNQTRYQHYDPTKRRPPWIKLHNDVLGDDDEFMRLTEQEQWQLVRIWLVASRSSSCTLDENGKVVPVVANDAFSLQRSIMSLKKVPLSKFIREGWLIPVGEDELVPAPSNDTEADSDADTALAPRKHRASTALAPPIEVEGREVELASKLKGSPRPPAARKSLPVNDHLIERLMVLCGSSADEGTEAVLRSYACQLPESSLAKVVESTATKPPADRSRYANGALQSEIQERQAA